MAVDTLPATSVSFHGPFGAVEDPTGLARDHPLVTLAVERDAESARSE